MNLSEMLLGELEQEAATTRKMLERVPQAAFAWKPHEKSMGLGQLAAHVANLFGTWLIASLSRDEFDLAESTPSKAESVEAILEAFDQNVANAIEQLKATTDESLFAKWAFEAWRAGAV